MTPVYRIRRPSGRIEETTDARVAQDASRNGARVTSELRVRTW